MAVLCTRNRLCRLCSLWGAILWDEATFCAVLWARRKLQLWKKNGRALCTETRKKEFRVVSKREFPRKSETKFMMKWLILPNMPLINPTQQPTQWFLTRRHTWNITFRWNLWRQLWLPWLITLLKWQNIYYPAGKWRLTFCLRTSIKESVNFP